MFDDIFVHSESASGKKAKVNAKQKEAEQSLSTFGIE